MEANHREYMERVNDDAKKDKYKKFHTCVYRAKRDNIGFELSYEQCERLFMGDCVYCGHSVQDGYIHGIDRLDSEQQYTYDNCVSCCQMCNYLKNILHPLVFIYLCENILIHLGIINDTPHPELMVNTIRTTL